jgi:tetratricopeptide (TPR) repeat protein
MSYINEALKKAQEEKNNRYGKMGHIVSDASPKRRLLREDRRLLIAVIPALVVAAGFIFFDFYRLPTGIPGKIVEQPFEKKAVSARSTPVDSSVARRTDENATAAKDVPKKDAEEKKRQEDKHAEIKRRHSEAALVQREGNLSRAKIIYGEILTIDPDNVEAMNNLGVVYLAEKKKDKALALFRRAVLLKRDYIDPYYNMACLYAQKNDIDQSLWYLKIAISMNNEVKDWARNDADMKNVVKSAGFKVIDGGAKN